MSSLPHHIAIVFKPFQVLFTSPTWDNIQVMLTGSILCQGARRVTTILRVMGLSHETRFERYHRVLNRARWNSVSGAKILLGLLVSLLPTSAPLLIAALFLSSIKAQELFF